MNKLDQTEQQIRRWGRQRQRGAERVFLVLVLAFLALHFGPAIITSLQPRSCAIGSYGNAATLVVRGPDAQRQCDQAVAQSPGTLVSLGSAAPALPLVCQYTIGQDVFTVRDSGLQLIGQQWCQRLSVRANN